MRIRNNKRNIRSMSSFGLFARPAELPYAAQSIVDSDGKTLAVHIRFMSVANSTKQDLVSDILSQFPNCHMTIMSPAVKCAPKFSVGGLIKPGHIHSTCTDNKGRIMQEGDASFTFDKTKKQQAFNTVPDSRLTGYQHENVYVGQCRFSSTEEDINKWVNISASDPRYPLYVAVVPFSSEEEKASYLTIARENKQSYQGKSYSLLTHYNSAATEIVRAFNCVAFNSRMNEDFFHQLVQLGDNPSPQLAYFKLLQALFPEQKSFIHHYIEDDILSDKEHFESGFHRYGVV